MELWENTKSVKKLWRLRTFIFENYQGKPLAFIKDDLLNRMDNYEEDPKMGLKTKDAVFKITFNSGTAVAATTTTIPSIVSGVPIAVSLPMGIGSTFLVGNIGIEISAMLVIKKRFKAQIKRDRQQKEKYQKSQVHLKCFCSKK